MEPLTALLIVLVSSYVLGLLAHQAGIPRVVGQLAAGIILAFLGLGLEKNELLAGMASVAIVLMFFFAGLEIDAKKFRKNLKPSILSSLFNTGLPLSIGFLAMQQFGFATIPSLVTAIALAVSSQTVTLDYLQEAKLLKTRLGELIVEAGLVDDVVELFLLSAVLAVIHSGSVSVQYLALASLVFVAALYLLNKYVIPVVLSHFASLDSKTGLFAAAIALTLTAAVLSEQLGFSSFVGAAIAGVLARSKLLKLTRHHAWKTHELTNSLYDVSFGFFSPIFFAWVGLHVDAGTVVSNAPLVALLAAIAVAATTFGTAIAIILSRGSLHEGIAVGLGVSPKGDVELAVAALALQQNAISAQLYSILVAMAAVTTLAAPWLFQQYLATLKRNETNSFLNATKN